MLDKLEIAYAKMMKAHSIYHATRQLFELWNMDITITDVNHAWNVYHAASIAYQAARRDAGLEFILPEGV